jgi:hypothetical protein
LQDNLLLQGPKARRSSRRAAFIWHRPCNTARLASPTGGAGPAGVIERASPAFSSAGRRSLSPAPGAPNTSLRASRPAKDPAPTRWAAGRGTFSPRPTRQVRHSLQPGNPILRRPRRGREPIPGDGQPRPRPGRWPGPSRPVRVLDGRRAAGPPGRGVPPVHGRARPHRSDYVRRGRANGLGRGRLPSSPPGGRTGSPTASFPSPPPTVTAP